MLFIVMGGQMKDPSKTNTELIQDISSLKLRIQQLEQSESEHREVEAALKESEERYRIAIEASNDGVAIVQNDVHVYVNQAFLKMFRYKTLDEIVGKHKYCIVHPDDYERVLNYAEVRKKGNYAPIRYEFKGIRKNNTPIDIEVSVNTISYQGAQAILAYLRDITERKHAEEEITREREKLKTLSENAPFGMVLIDKEGHFNYINRKFTEFFGYDLYDIPDGRTWCRKAYPDTEYRHMVISAWREDLADAKSGEEKPNVFTVTCKDETQKIVQFIFSVLISGDYLMTCEDITERKRLERAIQYQNLLLTTQQETSVDGILVVDDQGAVLSYNKRFVEIWGIPPEVLKTRADEQLLQAVMDKLAKPEEFLRKVRYLYEHQKETSRDEIALVDGRVLDRYSASVVGDEGKYYGRVWYFRDVTEQKKTLEALELRERELIVKSKTLEEVNIALKVLLEQREKDKNEQEDKILFNVRKLILPYIDSLRQRRLDDEQRVYLDILETNLKNIISPFAKKLTSIQDNFTPLEIRVADFIRDGKTAKEIANTFGVSESAINLHRQHIRNKLGLNNKKINLTTYLLSLTS